MFIYSISSLGGRIRYAYGVDDENPRKVTNACDINLEKKALSWSSTYPQQSLYLVSEQTGLRLGKVKRIATLRSEIMSGKMQFTGSLLRIISSVQFLGKHENSFGYI